MDKQIIDNLDFLILNNIRLILEVKYIYRIEDNILKFIGGLIAKEVQHKNTNSMLYNLKIAGFPIYIKVECIVLEFQPSLQKQLIESIIHSNFYYNSTNIIFTGSL